jgi:DUF1009 family protein
MDDGTDLAIIGGSGELPLTIKKFYKKALFITFNNSNTIVDNKVVNCEFEKLGFLFDSLKQNQIRRVVMAGAMARPQFDKSKMDKYTQNLLPKLNAKLVKGDNELLCFIAEEFENKGYQILGASEIISDVTVAPGFVCGSSYEFFSRDISRADHVLKALGPEDIGQGVVIENGLVLGIETLQGTNELLGFVEQTASHLRIKGMGGIFVKRPKVDQDLRFDMPVVGPKTVELACQAGLRGLVISPGSVMLLERHRCIEIAEANNFFILAKDSSV